MKKRFGKLNTGLNIEPGRSVNEENDGTVRGSVKYSCDKANWRGVLPLIWSRHPDFAELIMFSRVITFGALDKVEMVGEYIGITSDPTPKIVSFPSSSGREPIETHKDFLLLAGTPADPKNGARFDPEDESFLGFFDAANDKYGVTSYITPGNCVDLSYWTYTKPNIRKRGSIINDRTLGGAVRVIPDVKNWLLIGMPYREIGPLYQVTEQYLGSGEKGWDKDIYKG